MAAKQTIEVPHLGGIKAGYKLSSDSYDAAKPTCVLINSMCTTVSLYNTQFEDTKLTDKLNLLAIEPLGHGATSCKTEHFTYWDSAIMTLQVMDKLGVEKAFLLGTSQGGWIVMRVAILAPERVCSTPPLLSMSLISSPKVKLTPEPDSRRPCPGNFHGFRIRYLSFRVRVLGPRTNLDSFLPILDLCCSYTRV